MDIINKIDFMLLTPPQHRDMYTLLEMAVFIDSDHNSLNEGFKDILGKVSGLAKAAGIHVSADGDGGLIGILAKSSKVMGEFIWHAIKAAGGNKDSVARVKELAKTEISKADMLDVLLRLDGLTLHTLTGPIHLIDNLTGWHIWAAIKTKTIDLSVRAGKAIDDLISVIKNIEDSAKAKAKGLLHGIARVLDLEDEQKKIQAI